MAHDSQALYQFEPFLLVARERVLRKGMEAIPLTPKEFDTLYVLVREAGRLVTKEQILAEVWPDSFVADGSLSRNISVLRKALGEGYIQTVPKSGYRFVAPVKQLDGCSGRANGSNELAHPPTLAKTDPVVPIVKGRSPRFVTRRRATGLAAFLLVVLTVWAAAIFLKNGRTPAQAAPPAHARLLVLPVENLTGFGDDQYLADGLTEEMISRLEKLDPQSLEVLAPTTAMRFQNSAKSPAQIGKDLHADYVLASDLNREGQRIGISVQVVRVDGRAQTWSAQYDRVDGSLIGIPEELALSIARPLRLRSRANPTALRAHGTRDIEAYEDFLQGRFFWNKRLLEDVSIGQGYFLRAIQRDPNYAKAYAALADSYIVLASSHIPTETALEEARQAAQKAISLDQTLAEPHTSLAYILWARDWDWVNAEREYRRSLELDPQYALAHHWYSIYLTSMKRFPEAITETEIALKLDPLSLSINYNAGATFMLANQDDRALRQLEKAIALDPNNPVAYGYLGQLYERQRKYDEAIAEFKKAASLDTGKNAYDFGRASSYVRSGRLFEAQKLQSSLERYAKTHFVNPYSFVVLYSAYQDSRRTLLWLNRAVSQHDCTALEINTDPRLDFVRSDPRFQAIVHEMRLPTQ